MNEKEVEKAVERMYQNSRYFRNYIRKRKIKKLFSHD